MNMDRRAASHPARPGLISTSARGVEKLRAQFAALIPVGRMRRPDEIAHAALFFACDESSFVAGVDLVVDGGMSAIRRPADSRSA